MGFSTEGERGREQRPSNSRQMRKVFWYFVSFFLTTWKFSGQRSELLLFFDPLFFLFSAMAPEKAIVGKGRQEIGSFLSSGLCALMLFFPSTKERRGKVELHLLLGGTFLRRTCIHKQTCRVWRQVSEPGLFSTWLRYSVITILKLYVLCFRFSSHVLDALEGWGTRRCYLLLY